MNITVNSTDTIVSSQLVNVDRMVVENYPHTPYGQSTPEDYWIIPPEVPSRTGLVDLPTITPTSPSTIPYPYAVYGPDTSRDEVEVRNIETGESMRVSRNVFENMLLQAFRDILRDGSQEGQYLALEYQRNGMTPELKEAVRETAMKRLGYVGISTAATAGALLKIKEAAEKLRVPDEPIKDIYYD